MADRQVIADFARSMGIATSGLRAQAGRIFNLSPKKRGKLNIKRDTFAQERLVFGF